MDLIVFLVVLSAALMHAVWNSIIQSSQNSFLETLNFGVWKIPLTLTLIILLPIPHPDSWAYIATSICIHSVNVYVLAYTCLLYTSPSPLDRTTCRMPSSA